MADVREKGKKVQKTHVYLAIPTRGGDLFRPGEKLTSREEERSRLAQKTRARARARAFPSPTFPREGKGASGLVFRKRTTEKKKNANYVVSKEKDLRPAGERSTYEIEKGASTMKKKKGGGRGVPRLSNLRGEA